MRLTPEQLEARNRRNRALAGAWDDCLDLEATHHVHCGQTDDHKEAARAFVEKREPVFTGR